ncbi:MAG: alpha/beta hydrolase [Kiritimatiellae bacterium]|nr:alpha/beta hydrolase [Kiritimatiellia bacterium]
MIANLQSRGPVGLVAVAIGLTAAGGVTVPPPANSSRNAGPNMGTARVEVYKRIRGVALNMYIFEPPAHSTNRPRPAIVFFFGGGWRGGTPAQFRPQAERLAARGMVAMCADYRVSSRHGVTAKDCVEDAKSAIRWVRANAGRLGVDPNRIAAAGGSAGGHLAACAGVVPGFETEGEDRAVPSVPNAMVLFNPVLVLAPLVGLTDCSETRTNELREQLGAEPAALSPAHHVTSNQPPCIIFHGTADTTVPYRTAEIFADLMRRHGNRCQLVPFEGAGHGFFNYGRAGGGYAETLQRTEEFLESLGYLEREATFR